MKYVAEISGNHLGEYDRAEKKVVAAAASNATHVKFQAFNPEQMVIGKRYINSGLWAGQSLKELYKTVKTPVEWLDGLFKLSYSKNLTPFASPFHPDDVEELEKIDCPIYKVASCEVTYIDLLESIADTRKPVVLSTGMATLDEITTAIHILSSKCNDITLLKCTASYPASYRDANLATMVKLKGFGYPVGVSDHTLSHCVPIVATSLGADMIEKHFTLNRNDGGPDATFSLMPKEFKQW